MSDELQSNDDLDPQVGNVGTKLLDKEEDSGENSEIWPDKKVYYVFSPSVGKQRSLIYTLTFPCRTSCDVLA